MGLMSEVQWCNNDDSLRPISDQQSLHVTFWFQAIRTVTSAEVVLKKYQVQYPVENPPKVNRTEPYHAVEKRH